MMDKFKVEPMTDGARACLFHLFMCGPSPDNRLPSKTGRTWLIDYGYCEREYDWAWLTSAGTTLAIEIGFGRFKERVA